MAYKLKLVYPGDEPGHEHIIELWTDGPHAVSGHVLDALFGMYGPPPYDIPNPIRMVPMRMEIVPNAPDVPVVRSRIPEEDEDADS